MTQGARVEFDPLYPHRWYQYMQEVSPVSYDTQWQMWRIFRFHDVQQILLDPATFSSQFKLGRGLKESMVNNDPPRHRQLRSLINLQFTPRMVAQLEPRIEAITHSLLDQVAEQGRMDIVDDLAHPLPTIVIAELLGIPSGDRAQFREWSDAVLERALSPERGQRIQAEMNAYFLHVIEQRRREPETDLISMLLSTTFEGAQLSEQELLSFCNLLLVAGNETTTTLIGNIMLCFGEYPEAFEAVQADISLLPNAIEETLRYRSPIQSVARVTTKETEICGTRIAAGERISPFIAAANCDERVFPNAIHFDLHRSSNRHIAFGHGIHFCLGTPLARLEAKVAFTVLLQRFKEIRRIPDQPLEPILNSGTQGIKHFPITFHL